MTEKRSQYRKRQKQDNLSRLLNRATKDQVIEDNNEDLNVNPEFTRSQQEKRRTANINSANNERINSLGRATQKQITSKEEREYKVNRLKKRLNLAILIVILLLVLVFVALFNL